MIGMVKNEDSNGVKLTMNCANWNEYNTRVVCELFVDQVVAGNHPNCHLSNLDMMKSMNNLLQGWI